MGYRSEVVLAVHKQVMGKFLQLIGQNDEMKTMCFSDAEVTEDYNGDGNFLFRWSGIKWYDSFEEVQAIEDFLDWCECEELELDDGIHSAMDFVRFVRIGEEMDDVVERGMGFWSVGVRRSILW